MLPLWYTWRAERHVTRKWVHWNRPGLADAEGREHDAVFDAASNGNDETCVCEAMATRVRRDVGQILQRNKTSIAITNTQKKKEKKNFHSEFRGTRATALFGLINQLACDGTFPIRRFKSALTNQRSKMGITTNEMGRLVTHTLSTTAHSRLVHATMLSEYDSLEISYRLPFPSTFHLIYLLCAPMRFGNTARLWFMK